MQMLSSRNKSRELMRYQWSKGHKVWPDDYESGKKCCLE